MEAADKEFVADTLAQTKGLGDTIGTLPDARETTEGIKQGMTLIDRFYNGGNMARQGVADILVTVLDQVIGRMRQRNANAQATIDRCNEECATLDKAIARIEVKFAPLRAEHEMKKARAEELRKEIRDGTNCLNDSVAIAKDALHQAKLATKNQTTKFNREMKIADRGYDGKGVVLPGREVNMRKNPNGPAARKPGDMLKDLQL